MFTVSGPEVFGLGGAKGAKSFKGATGAGGASKREQRRKHEEFPLATGKIMRSGWGGVASKASGPRKSRSINF